MQPDPYDFDSVAAMTCPVQPYRAVSHKQKTINNKPMPLVAKKGRSKLANKLGSNMAAVIVETGRKMAPGYYERRNMLYNQTGPRTGYPGTLMVAESNNDKWNTCVDYRIGRESDLFGKKPQSCDDFDLPEVDVHRALETLFPSLEEYHKTVSNVRSLNCTYSPEYAVPAMPLVVDGNNEVTSNADPDVRAELYSMISSGAAVASVMTHAVSAGANVGSPGTINKDTKLDVRISIPQEVPQKESCKNGGITSGTLGLPKVPDKKEGAKPMDVDSNINYLENDVSVDCSIAIEESKTVRPDKRKHDEHERNASDFIFARPAPPQLHNNNSIFSTLRTRASIIQPTTSNSGNVDYDSDVPSCSSYSSGHVTSPTVFKNEQKRKHYPTVATDTKLTLPLSNGQSTFSDTTNDYCEPANSNLTDDQLLGRVRTELSNCDDDDVGSQFVDLRLKMLNLAARLRRNLDELRRFGMF